MSDTNKKDAPTPPAPAAKPGEQPQPAGAVGAATLEELEKEFGDEPKFVLDSLKGKLTLAQAAVGYAKLQKDKAAAATQDAATARGELAKVNAEGKQPAPVQGNKRVDTAPPGTAGAQGSSGDETPEDVGTAEAYTAFVESLRGSLGTTAANAKAQKLMPKGYAAWRKVKLA